MKKKKKLLIFIAADIAAKPHMQKVMKRASATSSLFPLKIQMKSLVLFFIFSFFLWKYDDMQFWQNGALVHYLTLQITGLVEEHLLND